MLKFRLNKAGFTVGLMITVRIAIVAVASIAVLLPGWAGGAPVKVIFDTDMYTDFDDAGALACLHALADAGECEILATLACTRECKSVAMCEIINSYYGRPDIPVGCVKSLGVGADVSGKHDRIYAEAVRKYAKWVKHAISDDAPDAAEVYRKILSSQPDKAVVICSVGFLTNLRKLVETDRDLIERKVSHWVAMGGAYPKGAEYNLMMDAESSRLAIERWPTPIVFVDFPCGLDCFAGRKLAECGVEGNPVADVFRGNIPSRDDIKGDPARYLQDCNGMSGRSAWDEVAALVAVRGETYFNVHRGTYRFCGTKGEDEWVPDEENGRNARVTEKLNKVEVGKIIDDLLCRKPRLADSSPHSERRTVLMLPGERWWGGAAGFGTSMPYRDETSLLLELGKENYDNAAAPFLVSDRGRLVFCTKPPRFDIGGGKIEVLCPGGDIIIDETAETLGAAYRKVMERFSPNGETPDELFFTAPQYNTWIELTYNQNEKDILDYAHSMLDNGLPPGVLMIDDTWQEGYGTWDFSPRRFSDPKGLCRQLHELGFKVMLWMCPFVSMDSPSYREIVGGLNYKGPGGFVANGRNGKWSNDPATVSWWNGKSALLDLTHPNAIRWFNDQLERLRRDYGVDGFKFDGGDVCYYARGTVAKEETATPVEQAAAYGRFALSSKTSEYRNSYGNCCRPVAVRLLDKRHDWESLGKLIPDMLATGMTGHPFVCPDMIGGGDYVAFLPGCSFDAELFIRSAQVHALSPMMQFSASPWRLLDAAGQEAIRRAVKTRQRFASEIVSLARQSGKTGEPMMRCLEYVFPGQGYADILDEFMMGDRLLVAPQLKKGATERPLKIPPGVWISDRGERIVGPCEIVVKTPLDRLPYFVKDSEKVMFFGDSITHGGYCLYYLQLLENLRHPGSGKRFYNAGFTGSTLEGGRGGLPHEMSRIKPDRVVVMFGMNDVRWTEYSTNELFTAEQKRMADVALAKYREDYPRILSDIRKAGVTNIVLVTPTPYDEYSTAADAPCRRHVNEYGLKHAAEFVRHLALREGVELVDLNGPLTEACQEFRTVAWCGDDRVHPGKLGHLLMATRFWAALGENGVVADTVLTSSGRLVSCVNATVDHLSVLPDGLAFEYQPKALPFPLTDEYRRLKELFPGTETINQELLKVDGLKDGDWSLSFDGREIGRFSSLQLAQGVNLAELDTTGSRLAARAAEAMIALHDFDISRRDAACVRHHFEKNGKLVTDRKKAEDISRIRLAVLKARKYPWYDWDARADRAYLDSLGRETEIAEEEDRLYRAIAEIRPVRSRVLIKRCGN